MSKVAFITWLDCLAHTGRCSYIADRLIDRGHEVTFIGPGNADVGYETERMEHLSLASSLDISRKKLIQFKSEYPLDAHREFLSIIDRVDADVYVLDIMWQFAYGVLISRGIPYVTLLCAAFTHPYNDTIPTKREFIDIIGPSQGMGSSISEMSFMRRLLGPGFLDVSLISKDVREYWDEVGHETGLKYFHEMTMYCSTLVLDLPTLYPTYNLPDICRVFPPILYNVQSDLPSWWEDVVRNGKRNILVTAGSTGEDVLLERVVNCLQGTEYNIIVAYGNFKVKFDHNVYSVDYLPFDDILDDIDVLVCHGGNLTLNLAIKHKVPVVAIPTHREQAMETLPILRNNLGVVLPKTDITYGSSLIKSALDRVLSPEWERETQVDKFSGMYDNEKAIEGSVMAIEELL